MIKEYEHNNMTWVDITQPTRDEVRTVMDRFNLSPTVARELLSPSVKPKIELYNNTFYLILHFPVVKHAGDTETIQELDFIVGKDVIITTRYDSIDPVHKFSKEFKVSSILEKDLTEEEGDDEHAGHLFFLMLSELYTNLDQELEYITASLDEIEKNIFQGKEKEMVSEISDISRILLTFKQAMTSHAVVLDSLKAAGTKLFGDSYEIYVSQLINGHFKISQRIERLQEIMREIRETNNSLLYTKQNEVMKNLTIMAFVTFPLSLLASVFGMNTESTPISGMEHDFWVVIAIMGILTLAFFLFFKQKKWL